jgi:hypothetical protein
MHGRVELSEVHWPSDRSQLRLVRGGDGAAGLTVQSDGEADTVKALCDVWRALALLACRALGRGGESEDAALEATLDASALDVFYYPPWSDSACAGGVAGSASDDEGWACAAHTDASMLTLLVAGTPDGLECRDPSGTWVAVPLAHGRCALLAGRSALSASAERRDVGGVGAQRPCEHRVRKQTEPGLARVSISLDVYAAGTRPLPA